MIAALKHSIGIPVIGNGDIRSAEDAGRMIAQTGCDAVMIGRRAIGDLHIFTEVVAQLQGLPPSPENPHERFDRMTRYITLIVAAYAEETARRLIRSRLGWFAKGLDGAAAFRCAAAGINSIPEALELVEAYRRDPTLNFSLQPDRRAHTDRNLLAQNGFRLMGGERIDAGLADFIARK